MTIRLCLLAIVASLLLAACSSSPSRNNPLPPTNPFSTNNEGPGSGPSRISRIEAKLKAKELYIVAHTQLRNGQFTGAIRSYNKLIARFPFTDYANQAEVEKIYAQYRNYDGDEALYAAARYLREYPRNTNAPYVQYLMGVIEQSKSQSVLSFLPISTAGRDTGSMAAAFSDFDLLIQRYPDSIYAGDARQRMVWLRNHIADHDMTIANFYFRRGAYLAAAKRAESVIATYPGAPATAKALLLLKKCFAQLKLTDQEKQVDELIASNQVSIKALNQPHASNVESAMAPPPPNGMKMAGDLSHSSTPTTSAESATAPAKKASCGFFEQVWNLVTFSSCAEKVKGN